MHATPLRSIRSSSTSYWTWRWRGWTSRKTWRRRGNSSPAKTSAPMCSFPAIRSIRTHWLLLVRSISAGVSPLCVVGPTLSHNDLWVLFLHQPLSAIMQVYFIVLISCVRLCAGSRRILIQDFNTGFLAHDIEAEAVLRPFRSSGTSILFHFVLFLRL